MFKKFRNRIPEQSIFVAIVIFMLFLPFLMLLTVFFDLFPSKKRRLFKEGYEAFLQKHEGHEFFCYTNRKRTMSIIEETILPHIDKSIHIVKLVGKTPKTDVEEKYISYALYNLNNVGFPNIMKVKNGELIDRSLRNRIYDAINNEKESELNDILDDGFLRLREYNVCKT